MPNPRTMGVIWNVDTWLQSSGFNYVPVDPIDAMLAPVLDILFGRNTRPGWMKPFIQGNQMAIYQRMLTDKKEDKTWPATVFLYAARYEHFQEDYWDAIEGLNHIASRSDLVFYIDSYAEEYMDIIGDLSYPKRYQIVQMSNQMSYTHHVPLLVGAKGGFDDVDIVTNLGVLSFTDQVQLTMQVLLSLLYGLENDGLVSWESILESINDKFGMLMPVGVVGSAGNCFDPKGDRCVACNNLCPENQICSGAECRPLHDLEYNLNVVDIAVETEKLGGEPWDSVYSHEAPDIKVCFYFKQTEPPEDPDDDPAPNFCTTTYDDSNFAMIYEGFTTSFNDPWLIVAYDMDLSSHDMIDYWELSPAHLPASDIWQRRTVLEGASSRITVDIRPVQ
jgi:hypothetical protein